MVACSIVAALGEVANRRVVVLGASGGIGTLLVPMLAAERAEVIAVCSAANRELVESLGATHAIDDTSQSYRDVLEKDKVDAFVDLVGGRDNERDGRAVTTRKTHRGVRRCSNGLLVSVGTDWGVQVIDCGSSFMRSRWRESFSENGEKSLLRAGKGGTAAEMAYQSAG